MPEETVGGEESRQGVPPSQAAGLLDAQIRVGTELLRTVASATDAGELQVISPQVSAWLTRNETILARIFGPTERESYRLAAPSVARTRDFEGRRKRLEQRIRARMQYLRVARAKIELARPAEHTGLPSASASLAVGDSSSSSAAEVLKDESSRKPTWKVILANQWMINICAPLIVAAVLASGGYAIAQLFHRSVLLTGTAVCESHRNVVGVWIAAATGQTDSGYAHLGPLNPSSTGASIGSEGTYSYLLPRGGSYVVHVGCGGNAQHWDSTNYSPELSDRTANLLCHDPTASERRVTLKGTCTVVATAP
jgi:hypothetical protein